MPHRLKTFSQDDLAVLQRCASGELSLLDASIHFGVTRERVRQYLLRQGLRKVHCSQAKRRRRLEAVRPFAENFAHGRVSIADICEATGLSRCVVVSMLRACGSRQRISPYHGKYRQPDVVISDEDVAAYRERRIQLTDIAARYRCSLVGVSKALRRQGVRVMTRPNRLMLILSNEDMDSLRTRKCTMVDMARRLGTTAQTVKAAMLRQGVTIGQIIGKFPLSSC